MEDKLILKNRLKEIRTEKGLSQAQLRRDGRCVSKHDQLY